MVEFIKYPIRCSSCGTCIGVSKYPLPADTEVHCEDCALSYSRLFLYMRMSDEHELLDALFNKENEDKKQKAFHWRVGVSQELHALENKVREENSKESLAEYKKKLDKSKDDDLLSALTIGDEDVNAGE